MASSKEYLDYIVGQLSELEDITYRAMMGEYIIYYRGRIAGGIYDNRFLVKPVKAAQEFMPKAAFEIPYKGAKAMLMVEHVEDKGYLKDLFNAMYDELQMPKKRKKS
ncbi:MAG: competence protein TfoX [Dorea sp.]|jgi:TfoX/Sxy family transcriptional regulator of competence genes|nr:competence protein TfoX [Dorea sp.]